MSLSELLFWTLVLAVFMFMVIKLVRDAQKQGAVLPPAHIAVWEMDDHVAQDVYDWIVYVTRMVGTDYLEQLTWERSSHHDFLLSDLRTVLRARTEEERLERLREIGHSFRLDTSIVDEPF